MSLNAEYKYTGNDFKFTDDMKKDFQKYGYIVVRNLLDSEELTNVKKCVENNRKISQNAFGVADNGGRYAKVAIWHTAGDDVAGMVSRCEKVVNTTEGLLGGEVYHYYTKLMMKDPKNAETGGGHEWHQDYGYWYSNSLLFPDLLTVFIAIDKAHKDNGCLQILEGSHLCGRLDHHFIAGQQGVDVDRVNAMSKVCPLKYVELNQGDALFFHCNLVHCSSANNSQDRRYAFLITYNRVSNTNYKESHYKPYRPLHKVSDSAIRDCTNYNIEDFFDPATQTTIVPKKFGVEQ